MMQPKKVLVVDDEEMLRRAIEMMLRRAGYDVVSADNGRIAFEMVEAGGIDVVVSDVRMPGGNGIELLQRLKERNPEVPIIIFITAFSDLSGAEAYNLGAAGTLSKPFRKEELLSRLQLATGSYRPNEQERSTITLKGKCGPQELGRGGVCFRAENLARVPLDVICALDLEGPGFPIKGNGIIRWSQALEKSGRLLGVEFVDMEERSKFEEWVVKTNPIPHIPLPGAKKQFYA